MSIGARGKGVIGGDRGADPGGNGGKRGKGMAHNAHVRYRFFVLCGGGAPSSPVVVLWSGQVHKLDRIDHRRLGFDVLRRALGVGV